MSNYDYAKLGNSCQTNGNELITSMKFFPINNPEYNLPYTRTHQYPADLYNTTEVGRFKFPEDIKRNSLNVKAESYKCCGKK